MTDLVFTNHKEITALRDIHEYHGLWSWVTSVDHKQIGILYMATGLLFLLVAAILALIIRIQLMVPMNHFVSQAVYNQIFTMHGTTMVFFMGMPILLGLTVYLAPLMIGARDMAFPRLNAFGYWIFLFGALMLYFSFMGGGGPSAGWFAYPPLTEKAFLFDPGTTYWALSLLLVGVGSVATAINIIVTTFTLRAPGMSMNRIPLFLWMMVIDSFLIIFALPGLNAALVMILFDRLLHTHFFAPNYGGSALLWQHLFWFFGHPEVYILIMPGWGAVSEVIPVFSRKVIYGAGFMAASTVAIGFLSMGVWVHHMFAAGLDNTTLYVFAFTSMLIAIPTGVKVWNWLATMWGGSIRFTTAMLFATAFILQFTIGGLTGVAFAAVPIDWQLTDSYFVVAHFHYVLLGGLVFALLSGFYYWYPKFTGRLLSERIGKWHFWLSVLGFNGTFFVLHILGLLGMPRRVWTYPRGMHGWTELNMFSSICSFVLVFSVFLFACNLIYSYYKGKVAGPNPWNAWTLEWATTSPPPPENFDWMPRVFSRRPLWDLTHPPAQQTVPGIGEQPA